MSAAKTNPNMCSAPSLAERRGRRRAEEGKKRYLDVGVGASTQRELRANIHVCLIEMTLWLPRDADMHKLKKKNPSDDRITASVALMRRKEKSFSAETDFLENF